MVENASLESRVGISQWRQSAYCVEVYWIGLEIQRESDEDQENRRKEWIRPRLETQSIISEGIKQNQW